MSKIPCEVIQDLMPSYVDGLTSPVTDKIIEEHVEECEKCRQTLETMRSGYNMDYTPDENDKKEIDFLKKNKKKNVRVLISSLAAAVILIAAVIFVRLYIVGEPIYGDWITCTVKVEDNHLSINGKAVGPIHDVARVSFTEKDGVVNVITTGVHSGPFYSDGFQDEYTAQSKIRQVKVNDRVIWEDGEEISRLASSVYETKHEYVGDASANGNTAMVLDVENRLGDFTMELETEKEPYGWTFYLNEDISGDSRVLKESDMEYISYILIGVTGNLGSVTFKYTVDGKTAVKTVDSEMATEFFGRDIKEAGKSVRLLDELIDMTGLE